MNEEPTNQTKKMKTVDIKGKKYVEVNERIKYFRANYKSYAMVTDIVELTDVRVVIKATVMDATGYAVSTGLAYEDKGSTFINKTSYIENCETSAIGRALGNFGIGIDTSVASADEVKTAIANQSKPKEKKAPNCGVNQIVKIKELIATTTIEAPQKKLIEDKLKLKVPFSAIDADKCIEYLTKNQ